MDSGLEALLDTAVVLTEVIQESASVRRQAVTSVGVDEPGLPDIAIEHVLVDIRKVLGVLGQDAHRFATRHLVPPVDLVPFEDDPAWLLGEVRRALDGRPVRMVLPSFGEYVAFGQVQVSLVLLGVRVLREAVPFPVVGPEHRKFILNAAVGLTVERVADVSHLGTGVEGTNVLLDLA